MSTPSETLDLSRIRSESRRIIKSQVHHFQALFLLLLPFSFSIIIYPIILQKTTTIFKSQVVSSLPIQVLVNLFYLFFGTILSICPVASISYSTFHAFHGSPVELITSLKSISQSFLPLLSTLIIQELGLALISLPGVYEYVQIYGSESFYDSDMSYKAFIISLSLVSLLILMYLQMKLILASVIVMVESKRGSEATKRSAYLVTGKRGVAFSKVLLFDLMVGGWFLGFYVHELWSWGFIFYMVIGWVYLSMLLLTNFVENVVFYFCCIEINGEEVLPSLSVEEVPLLR